MSSDVASDVMSEMKKAVSATLAEIKKMQPGPPNTRGRSAREQRALWDRIVAIPEPERQGIIDEMSKRVKHDAAEEKPCELCKFISKHAQTATED